MTTLLTDEQVTDLFMGLLELQSPEIQAVGRNGGTSSTPSLWGRHVNNEEEQTMDTKQERAFEQILHSIQQAQIPGNDWRRELKLIESTCRAAIEQAALQSQPMDAEHWAELHRLRAKHRPSDREQKMWKAAAISERVMRVRAEKALQSQAREDAALAETLREAAQIIAAIPPEHAPQNIRWPIVDELEGFALRIDHARRIEGDGK